MANCSSMISGRARAAARELHLRVVVDGRLQVGLADGRRQADGGRGLLAGLEVGGRDVHDAVRVDLEGDLDLDLAAVADAEPGELELAEQLAAVRPVRLALVDADLHAILAVAAGGDG